MFVFLKYRPAITITVKQKKKHSAQFWFFFHSADQNAFVFLKLFVFFFCVWIEYIGSILSLSKIGKTLKKLCVFRRKKIHFTRPKMKVYIFFILYIYKKVVVSNWFFGFLWLSKTDKEYIGILKKWVFLLLIFGEYLKVKWIIRDMCVCLQE